MKAFTILIIAVLFSQFALGQVDSTITASLTGKVIDKANRQPLMFATIKLYKTGVATPETGTETDLDGNYSISNLDEGIYDIKLSYVGYGEKTVSKVKITNGKITTLNIALEEGVGVTNCWFFYVEPMIRLDNTSSGRVYKAEDLRNSPIRN